MQQELAREVNKDFITEGTYEEQYTILYSSDIDWPAKDTLILSEDTDYTITAKMGNSLLSQLSMSAKLSKVLSENGDNHAQFNRVFSTIAKAENMPVCLKTRGDKVVGVMDVTIPRMLNVDFPTRVLPFINSNQNLKQVYFSNGDEESYAVYINKTIEPFEFLGTNLWHSGVIVCYSSLGLFEPTIMPAIIPVREDFIFYALYSTKDEVSMKLDLVDFTSPEVARAAISISSYGKDLVNMWENICDKEISINEYEAILKTYLRDKQSEPEHSLLMRLTKIYDCHKVDPEDKKSKRWKETACTGVTLGEIIYLVMQVTPDLSKYGEPSPMLSKLLDTELNLSSIAHNNVNLDNITWDTF